jgi:hypothetical protein
VSKTIIRLSDKSDKLTIRCAVALKQAVGKRAIDENTSIEKLCVVAIAEKLGIEVEDDAANAA